MNADSLALSSKSAVAGEAPAFAFDLNLRRAPLRPPCTPRFSFSYPCAQNFSPNKKASGQKCALPPRSCAGDGASPVLTATPAATTALLMLVVISRGCRSRRLLREATHGFVRIP